MILSTQTYNNTIGGSGGLITPVEPIPEHEDQLRGRIVQWMIDGPNFGLTTVVERMVRKGGQTYVILQSGEWVPVEQFHSAFNVTDHYSGQDEEISKNVALIDKRALDTFIDPQDVAFDNAHGIPRYVAPDELPRAPYVEDTTKKPNALLLASLGEDVPLNEQHQSAWEVELQTMRKTLVENPSVEGQKISLPVESQSVQPQTIPTVLVLPSHVESDPVAVLLKNKKPNLVELTISLHVDIPTRGLYETITSSFEDAGQKVIDLTLSEHNMILIKEQVKASLEEYYAKSE